MLKLKHKFLHGCLSRFTLKAECKMLNVVSKMPKNVLTGPTVQPCLVHQASTRVQIVPKHNDKNSHILVNFFLPVSVPKIFGKNIRIA